MITLILLSVITFMAVTFLVVSRSEHGSVGTTMDQTTAKLTADFGTEEAKMRIIAPMMAFANPFNFDLMVSTNFVNSFGFRSGLYAFTNVSYNYPNGTFLKAGSANSYDFELNQVNLLYSPRPPVFIRSGTNTEFRYYLDLNRNGQYDTNGYQPVIGVNGPLTVSNSIVYGYFVGDPEWVGILEKPGFPHAPTNRFIGRYAYIVIPVGKTLDLNYIYNYAKQFNTTMSVASGDGFRRNQGASTYEINLAALLVDLNTNFWPLSNTTVYGSPYLYDTTFSGVNKGAAFDDALAILRYRYNGNYRTALPTVLGLFGAVGVNAFKSDYVDAYLRGPLMTGSWWGPPDSDTAIAANSYPWSGGDNPVHLFTTQDLLDPNKIKSPPGGGLGFVDRMRTASAMTNSYDRYTYFRLLSMLGTDSASDPPDKMNLNWDNLVQSNALTGARSVTNFIPWRPIDFFTNAAMRMLANAGYGTNVINGGTFHIQIYPTNHYTPSVHRFLQLAANIYDATTDHAVQRIPFSPDLTNTMGLPSVFRPVFQNNPNGQIYITGFKEETDATVAYTNSAPPFRDLSDPLQRSQLQPYDMVYGIPLIVGATKGLPNFNEYAMQTMIYVTRKLQFRRPGISTTAPVNETNQMFIVGVSNVFALEAWNSYTNLIRRDMDMIVSADVTMLFTNESKLLASNRFSQGVTISTNFWPGFLTRGAFKIPLSNAVTFLPTATYHHGGSQSGGALATFDRLSQQFDRGQGFPVPHWWVNMSVRLRFILVDKGPKNLIGVSNNPRIIDYVNLTATEDSIDITDKLKEEGDCDTLNAAAGSLWCTNRAQNSASIYAPTYGILSQVHASQGNPAAPDWNSFNLNPIAGLDYQKAVDGFRVNMGLSPLYYRNATYYNSNIFYAPYDPYRKIYQHTIWQANDPLVHYTVGDLTNLEKTNNVDFISQNPPLDNIGKINQRYEPWTTSLQGHSTSMTLFDLSLKDPMVRWSADWEFPTNKLPNVGWLGRIHRGTPWQTIYLKAPVVPLTVWQKWCGNGQLLGGTTNVPDAILTHPTNDFHIIDLFTTAFNDNSSRGQLSINQTNLAAWSAILTGAIALRNTVSDAALLSDPLLVSNNTPVIIEPAGVYDPYDPSTLPPLVRIVNGINNTRSRLPGQVFTRLGDILSVPELTVGSRFLSPTNYIGAYPNGYWTGVSPFINWGNPTRLLLKPQYPTDTVTQQQERALNDAAVERLPQQILGLLRLDQAPRFVIYSYGQTLKPAEHSIITSGPYFGLCTNYQVTAEVATRSVVKIIGAPGNPQVVIENFNVLPAE